MAVSGIGVPMVGNAAAGKGPAREPVVVIPPGAAAPLDAASAVPARAVDRVGAVTRRAARPEDVEQGGKADLAAPQPRSQRDLAPPFSGGGPRLSGATGFLASLLGQAEQAVTTVAARATGISAYRSGLSLAPAAASSSGPDILTGFSGTFDLTV